MMDSKGELTNTRIGTLIEGQYFGEVSFLDRDKPRPLSVIAIKELHLIELSNHAYEEAKKYYRARLRDENREFLKGVFLLGHFFSFTARSKILEDIAKKDHRHRLEYLYKEGDKVNKVYIIKKGEFKVTKKVTVLNQDESWKVDAGEVYQDPMKAKKKEQLIGKKVVEQKDVVELAFAFRGCFLGVEDLLNNGGIYTTTVQCIS